MVDRWLTEGPAPFAGFASNLPGDLAYLVFILKVPGNRVSGVKGQPDFESYYIASFSISALRSTLKSDILRIWQ